MMNGDSSSTDKINNGREKKLSARRVLSFAAFVFFNMQFIFSAVFLTFYILDMYNPLGGYLTSGYSTVILMLLIASAMTGGILGIISIVSGSKSRQIR